MKFVQRTRDQLTIRLFPLVIWSVGIFFLVLAVTASSLLAQLFLVAVGILIFSLGQASTCHFNKITDQVLIKRWTLLGSKQRHCSIRDIVAVHVETSGDTHRVNLVLAEKELFPLTTYYSSGLKEKQQVAKLMREFLHLRHQPMPKPVSAPPFKLLELAAGEHPDRQRAIAEYRAAIAKDPDNPKNYYSLLLLLGVEQQEDDAKATFAELKAALLKRCQPGYAAVLEEIFNNITMKRS
ncbi:hypothetical protein ACN4EK_31080 [Pantanalinema rosaneae CENA516]|uniref:hypothetical protein n=1 Tax=Pantanalinema rosaneae TaxID=1620701 RepID=UPI003D6F3F13